MPKQVKGKEPEAPEVPEEKILDLDELVEPVGQFRIGGELYKFTEMGALGLMQQREIEKKWGLVQQLRKLAKPKPSQEETYERAIRQLIVLISSMPKDMAQKTQLSKLVQAVICFFSFRTASQVALVVRMAELAKSSDQQIGETSSLGSIVTGLSKTP